MKLAIHQIIHRSIISWEKVNEVTKTHYCNPSMVEKSSLKEIDVTSSRKSHSSQTEQHIITVSILHEVVQKEEKEEDDQTIKTIRKRKEKKVTFSPSIADTSELGTHESEKSMTIISSQSKTCVLL